MIASRPLLLYEEEGGALFFSSEERLVDPYSLPRKLSFSPSLAMDGDTPFFAGSAKVFFEGKAPLFLLFLMRRPA